MLALLTVAALSPAHATECWEVTGWTSTGAPGWPVPAKSERALLAPVGCDVTPEQTRWVDVTQFTAPASAGPTDLYVRVDAWDPARADGTQIFGGLRYQGHYMGAIPIVWRPKLGTADPLSWYAPLPDPPQDGAEVLWIHRDLHASLFTDSSYGVYLRTDVDTIDEIPAWSQWQGSPFTLEDLGNGQWRMSEVYGYCLGEGPNGLQSMYCTDPGTVFTVSTASGGYRLEAPSGLCVGGVQGTSWWPVLVSCGSSDAVYDLVTLVAGTPAGGGGGEPPPIEGEM
ncbi:MAG: hypothetical protein H6738_25230 [Alphaproteobacteria bacterium]|nr:hypothetical protein [Alphaproteobacteria bacterium]